jgi:hypothetical protein
MLLWNKNYKKMLFIIYCPIEQYARKILTIKKNEGSLINNSSNKFYLFFRKEIIRE